MQTAQRVRRQRAGRFVARETLPRRGVVVTYSPEEPNSARSHEPVTRAGIAKKLAVLLGYEFLGDYDGAADYGERPVFVVPSQTIVGLDNARALGIRSEHDFFGGVVPYEFAATKTITHGVIGDDARVPEGWATGFTNDVRDVVLRGYSAFSVEDARRAGRRLLEHGTVRVKQALAVGGRGQTVVTSSDELDRAVDAIDAHELCVCGVTLEENLIDVTTYSVGRVLVDDLVATYFGTQMLTTNHRGHKVYGGSDLTVVRGEFDALLAFALPDAARVAVEQARVYDAAADRHYHGFIASRRNYDVAAGTSETAHGERRCGVLEQSWRIGGASGAEVAALECFRNDASVRVVRAACFEIYGDTAPPPHATVYFDGVDDKVGRMLKYTAVEPYVDA